MTSDKIPLTQNNYIYLYDNYATDIIGFAQDIFLSPYIDGWQCKLWGDFYKPERNVFYARPSGHGVGKSFSAALTALHFLLFHPDVGCVLTANTRSQLLNKLGRELRVQLNRSLISNWFEPTATKVYRKNFNGKPDETAFIELAANNPSSVESFSGLHPTAILFVADECSALDPGIHQAIMSSTPKNVPEAIRRVLYLGNPLRSTGVFYDVCNNPKISKYWNVEYLDARECYYSDKAYLQMLIDSYGIDSNIVKSRVLGEFPGAGADALIDSEKIDAASTRELTKVDYGREPIIMGVDVARHGDDLSVLLLRQGRKVLEVKSIDDNTIPSLARAVVDLYRATYPRPKHIIVDSTGLGSGVYDILEEWRLPVVEFISKNQAADSKKFSNVKSETYWALKEWIENEEPQLPQIPLLLDELRALTYDYDGQLRIQIIKKALLKKELGRSPDHADALMLTLYKEDLFLTSRRGLVQVRPVKKSRYAW